MEGLVPLKYLGAQFFKCALQVNPHSYARNRGNSHGLSEGEYNRGILQKCQENRIEVVGLANHGNVDGSESLRELLQNNDVVVFPGFEIASMEKIHMVCLYNEDTPVTQLNHHLGALMGDNSGKLIDDPTHPSSLTCLEIARIILNDQKAFWYAAHATNTSGILRLSGAGDNFVHIWRQDDLVRVVQIPGGIDALPTDGGNPEKYRQIIENKNLHYQRQRPIAVINAKDVEHPDDLENASASCQIKMTTRTFSSFKAAFFDSDSRIRLNRADPPSKYAYIRRVRWSGAGFFGDNEIALSPNLNAIIGGRGAGKSSLLESIRYALDLPIHDADGDKRIADVHRHVMADSQVFLDVFARDGEEYTIRRRFGAAPAVFFSKTGEKSNLSPSDILPNIQLLGQNEILAIESNEEKKMDLIRRFLPDSASLDKKMQELRRQLEKNRKDLLALKAEYDELSDKIDAEGKLREIEKRFESLGIADKLKNAQLLQRERNIVESAAAQIEQVEAWLEQGDSLFEPSADEKEAEGLPNQGILLEIKQLVDALRAAVEAQTAAAKQQIEQKKSAYRQFAEQWREAAGKVKDTLGAVIAKLPDMQGKSGREVAAEYQNAIARLNLITQIKPRHAALKAEIDRLEKERAGVLDQYQTTAFERFNRLRTALQGLNKRDSVKGFLQIEPLRCAEKSELKSFLCALPGVGHGKVAWLDDVPGEIDLAQWSDMIRQKNNDGFLSLHKKHGAGTSFADILFRISFEQRLMLEEIELRDTVVIKLNTAAADAPAQARYVELRHLSPGQKCTAILHLMLLDSDAPLIIDQPEDNLDNAFIADRIIGGIRAAKTGRQFIFATHNANIPVFGDAELIAIMQPGADAADAPSMQIGSIDKEEIRDVAAQILEGGKAAFNLRKEKYGF